MAHQGMMGAMNTHVPSETHRSVAVVTRYEFSRNGKEHQVFLTSFIDPGGLPSSFVVAEATREADREFAKYLCQNGGFGGLVVENITKEMIRWG